MIAWFSALREKLKGWKTIIIGGMVAAPLALLQLLEAFQVVDITTVLPPPWGQRLALAIAVLMVLLRLVTNTPVGTK